MMKDTIKENNELLQSRLLTEDANRMTKGEFISMNLLAGMLKNTSSESDEVLVERAINLSKMLIKKINQ